MSQSLYDFSVPVFAKALTNLKAQLMKAEAFCAEKKVEELTLLQARLAVDMLPLVKQVQIASDNAKGTVARLVGIEPPKMEDTEQSLAELTDADLLRLFAESQPSNTSPEAGYSR